MYIPYFVAASLSRDNNATTAAVRVRTTGRFLDQVFTDVRTIQVYRTL